MKFPSYLVRHPNKVVWLIHQFRQAYDRFGTSQSDFTASPEDTRWRELIAEADRTGLTEARKIFTNAKNTADRLAALQRDRGRGALPSAAARGPVPVRRTRGASRSRSGGSTRGSGWTSPSRRRRPGSSRSSIAGDGPDEARLEDAGREERRRRDVRGRASPTTSSSRSTRRAASSSSRRPTRTTATSRSRRSSRRKPVVTCTDSGGPLEFVVDGENGRVVAPDAAALARRRRRFSRDPDEARRTRRERLRKGPRHLLGRGRAGRCWRGRNPVKTSASRRLSVGFIGPLPPDRSGIADYDAEILSALSKNLSVDVVSYEPARASARSAAGHDVLLFQIGNDPLHAPSVEALFDPGRPTPAVVVLHDFVLHHLFAAAYLDARARGRLRARARAGARRAEGVRLGERHADGAARSPSGTSTRGPTRCPAGVIRAAEAVVAHSRARRRARSSASVRARASSRSRTTSSPAPRTPRDEARAALGLPPDRPVARHARHRDAGQADREDPRGARDAPAGAPARSSSSGGAVADDDPLLRSVVREHRPRRRTWRSAATSPRRTSGARPRPRRSP